MGPRGFSYLHFISVIRGGEVIKTPNISRVNRVPNFKNVEEIYVSIGSECGAARAQCPPHVDRSLAIPYGCDEVKSEVKIESMEEENEPDFDLMTLKQLRKTCKSKKRKTSTSVNWMDVKEEDIGSQHQEDELDLKETLGSWKRKLLKKTNAKKGTTKGVSQSFRSNSSAGRSKGIPHDQAQQETSWEICKHTRIKVEDAEFDYSQPQPLTYILPDNPGNATREILGASEYYCPNREIKTILGGLQSLYLSGTSDEHFLHPVSSFEEAESCGRNQASYKHLERDQLMNPLIYGDSKPEDDKKVNDTLVAVDQSLDLPSVQPIKEEAMADLITCDEAAVWTQNCVLNEVSYEHLECVQLQKSPICEDSKLEDAREVGSEAISGDKSLLSPPPQQGREEGISIPMTYDEAPETVFLECDKTGSQDYNSPYSCVQAPWTGPDRICQNNESTVNDKATCTKDNKIDIEAEVIKSVVDGQSSTWKPTKSLPSAKDVVSGGNVASAIEEEQSIHNITSAHVTCPHDIQPCDSIDLLTGSSARENCLDNVPRPPERLFSARKTISPNSQERLCRVMNSIQMQGDSEIQLCREKLSFDKDYEDKSSTSKTDLKRGRIIFTSKRHDTVSTTSTRQAMRKGKDERKGPYFKGIPKGPQSSNILQQAARRCSSIQSCSQNAVLFSQQQMNDIERLAQKLVTEMQSMKDIFVDALHCESRAGAKLRYNIDEVRVAVENAAKVEETTRKWLSMMTRDCNRFCKIMRLAEADGGSPEKAAAHKERKIMFADEAGGRLCHVRVFEATEAGVGVGVGVGVAPPMESQIREEALGA